MATISEPTLHDVEQEMGLSTEGNQFLTFILGDEHYGVDILRVQEIKGYPTVTRIPNTPVYINGVINLRGTIVPIIDLRAKFSMEKVDYTAATVVVVVVIQNRIMGMVVDAVSDVLDIPKKDIQPPPQFGTLVDVSFVSGIAKCSDKLIALLDLDRLLSAAEMNVAATAAN
jgi:purine-binding chemotaxis protein CheW